MKPDEIKVTLSREQMRRLGNECMELAAKGQDVDIEFIYDPNDNHVVDWVIVPMQSPLSRQEGGQV